MGRISESIKKYPVRWSLGTVTLFEVGPAAEAYWAMFSEDPLFETITGWLQANPGTLSFPSLDFAQVVTLVFPIIGVVLLLYIALITRRPSSESPAWAEGEISDETETKAKSATEEAEPEGGTSPPRSAEDHPDQYVRARVVPWPEGAPDPSTVPQVGERVVGIGNRAKVFTVLNGIPVFENNTWRLWVTHPVYGPSYPKLEDIRVYVGPTKHAKLYSADQIEEAFHATAYRSAAALIKRMNV